MASGAEIVVYFTSMGKFAFPAIILAVILICAFYSLIASYAAERSEGRYKGPVPFFYFQERAACVYAGIVMGAVVSSGAMLAGASALCEEFLPISGWAGALITLILGTAVVIKGVEGIAGVCKVIVLLL